MPVTSGPTVSYQPGISQGLWEAIPPGMRPACFSADTVPEEYRGGLARQRGRSGGIHLSPLPEAIRQELASCMFRNIARAGKVDVTHMRALTGRLGEVIAELGRQLRPRWPALRRGQRWPPHLGAQLRACLQPAPSLL